MLKMEELKREYKPGTPIITDDIRKNFSYSNETIRKSLSLMVKTGELKRFSQGVYFISEPTIFGDTKLNPEKVIEKKYLGTKSKPEGIYAGMMLLNKMGLTTQVPNVVEVVTNKESTRKRQVVVGKQKVILRSTKTTINKDNISIIEILEAFKMIDKLEEFQIKIIKNRIKTANIKRNKLDQVLITYSNKIYKKLVESGIMNEFTS